MKEMADNSVSLFICDLPYGCIDCEWDNKIDLEQFWIQVKRLAKNENTPVIMFCTMRFGYELIKSNPSWFRYDMVWEKSNAVGFLLANKQPLRAHENIFVFSKKSAHYNRIDITGDFPKGGGGRGKCTYQPNLMDLDTSAPTKEGIRCVKTVIKIPNKKTKGGHPTAKPKDLYKWLIERYSAEGDTVLDPTAGSFNACAAGYELGRHMIGIEMNEIYFDKACRDLEMDS